MAQSAAEQRAACTPDALRFCTKAIPDVDRLKSCLEVNYARLSARCRAVFPARGAMGNANEDDAAAAHGKSRIGWSADPALTIARQVVSGLGQACDAHKMSTDVCDAYGQFLGTFGQ